jgi:hypothetical protein
MASVVYLVPDLVFSSKIVEAAAELNVDVQGARDAATLVAAAKGARLVVVDLRATEAFRALEMLAADPATSGVPSVGFVGHEHLDVMETARALGCGTVLAKGAFATQLPALLRGATSTT